MAELDPQEARRREARNALGGEKMLEQEKAEEKRRREAILAMEGEKHRERRERTEAEDTARRNLEQSRAQKLADSEAAAQAATARAAAERARAEEAILEKETSRRNKIGQAEELTEKLRGTTTKLSGFRTIKTDMARAVRERGLSLSRIATLGDERGAKKDTTIGGPRHSRWLAWLLLVVIIGAGGFYGWRWWSGATPSETPIEPVVPTNSILRADFTRPVDIASSNSVSQARSILASAAEQKAEQSGLVNLALTRDGAPLSFANFRIIFGLNLPDTFTRHLRDNFFYGLYDSGETRSRFLILQTSFFDQAWSAIFDWERYLAADLGPVLGSASDNKSTWLDRVIHNKDVRELVGESGNPIIVYGFIDEETIVIARDEQTYTKVFERLIDQG